MFLLVDLNIYDRFSNIPTIDPEEKHSNWKYVKIYCLFY